MVGWSKFNYFPNESIDKKVPPMTGLMFGNIPTLVVHRPEVIEELLITKNKFYDKHPISLNVIGIMLVDGILFAKSDIKWQQKRKVISTALYKE